MTLSGFMRSTVVGHIKRIVIAIGLSSTPEFFLYLACCPHLSELRLTFLIPTSIAWSVHIIDMRYSSSSSSHNFAQDGVKSFRNVDVKALHCNFTFIATIC